MLHAQCSSNLHADVLAFASFTGNIHLLQRDYVCICTPQRVDDGRQLVATLNIPLKHTDRLARSSGGGFRRSEVVHKNFARSWKLEIVFESPFELIFTTVAWLLC